LLSDLDTTVLDAFSAQRSIWSPSAKPSGSRGFPVVRLNALELTTVSSVCRRVDCDIGGHAALSTRLISHDLGVVHHLSDRVLLMHRGEAVESGEADDIFQHPERPYTQNLVAAVPRLTFKLVA
jgi:ABC-type antimicrobial peptide transport system ATPase subunit